MLNRFRSKLLGQRIGKYKIIFMQLLIVGLALSFAACSMFEGLVGTKPKVEAPPPKPAEAPPVASKPEAPLTPSTAPAVSAPKQAKPPGTPPVPPTEPKKRRSKTNPPAGAYRSLRNYFKEFQCQSRGGSEE